MNYKSKVSKQYHHSLIECIRKDETAHDRHIKNARQHLRDFQAYM